MHIAIPNDAVLDTVRMSDLLAEWADRRGKVGRLMAEGALIPLRRGLYAGRRDLDPRALAGPIYGPSYVSFETALAWHGMIPEGVREILSACLKRGALFENPLGRFRYLTIPKAAYPIGIHRIDQPDAPFLIASPTKALVDRIAREPGFRSMADVGRWLEDMRVDPDAGLDGSELAACADRYGRPSVRWLFRYATKHKLSR